MILSIVIKELSCSIIVLLAMTAVHRYIVYIGIPTIILLLAMVIFEPLNASGKGFRNRIVHVDMPPVKTIILHHTCNVTEAILPILPVVFFPKNARDRL